MGRRRPVRWDNPKKRKRRREREFVNHNPTVSLNHGTSQSAKSCKRSLLVTSQLNGKAVNCLIDTGATDSLMSSSLYEQLPESRRPELERVRQTMHGVDGESLKVRGKINGQLIFGHCPVNQDIIVAEIPGDVLILGMDFLVENNCQLDLPNGILRLKGEELKCWDEDENHARFRVVCRERVDLFPHQSMIIPGKMKRTGNITEWGVIDPNRELSESCGVLVAPIVISSAEDDIPVRIRNCSNQQVTLKPNQLLGWCESVECCGVGQSDSDNKVSEPCDFVSSKKGRRGRVSKFTPKQSEFRKKEVPEHLTDLLKRSSGHLNDEEKAKLATVLCQYADLFSKNKEDLGKTGLIKHHIDIGDAKPVKQAPRRLPFEKRKIEKEEVERMQRQGIIEPSTSPWASPVVLVKKKDGTMRFCIDYRKLNSVTVKDSYPLPRIDDCFDSLGGAVWFSTMDLSSGYWQVEMEEESKAKTSFVTSRNGLYQFRVMPFGLVNAPGTFERLMEEVMRGMQWEECLIYLDDIISFGRTFEEELDRLVRIFDRLKVANLKLKPSKCQFFQEQVEFLGHVVSRDGITTSSDKIQAVRDWPEPKNLKELRSFLGLCSYYRKFILGFAEMARPLNSLVKKNTPFVWASCCQEAFEKLKQALINAPILAYPLEEGQFILDTDASNEAVGAVLTQIQEGQEKVIAYYSRTLNVHERQYCVTRKEMLAVVSAVRKFKSYLWGRPVKLRTDNAAVSYMLRLKEPEGQMARWLEFLSCYDLEVSHRPGRNHGNADALSRRPCRQCGREDEPVPVEKDIENVHEVQQCAAVTRQKKKAAEKDSSQKAIWLEGWDNVELRDSQLRDNEIGMIMKALDAGEQRPQWSKVSSEGQALKTLWGQWKRLKIVDGVLYRRWEDDAGTLERWQVVVPREKRRDVLHYTHDSPVAGHLGVRRTIERVKQGFFWVGIKECVRKYCRECDECTARKLPNVGAPKVPMKEHITGSPMARIAVDILGPLTETERHNIYVLVISDYFTKWTTAVALPNQEAKTVVKAIVEEWICIWGTPYHIHSDQGRNFESHLFQEVMTHLGVKKTRTTPLHPQSNGMVEKWNATLLNMLTIYAKDCPKNWDDYLKFACMAYNSSVHSTTGFTPYRLRFGEEMRLPVHVLTGNPNYPEIDTETYLDDLNEKLRKVHDVARKVTKRNVKLYKDQYDSGLKDRQLVDGQAVWVFKPKRKKGVCPKLQCKWEKGYTVTQKLDDVLYRVQKGRNGKGQVVHIQRLMPYLGHHPPKWWKSGDKTCNAVSGRKWVQAVRVVRYRV